MIEVRITKGQSGSALENLLAEAFINPAKAATHSLQLRKNLDKFRASALGMTAARLRRKMVEAFELNTLGWKEPNNVEYSNWFGITGQPVSISGLIKSNKPVKTVKKSGEKKGRGYSRKTYIRPPQKTRVGGRFVNMMRYEIDADGGNFKVGMLNDFAGSTWAGYFRKFQDGGQVRFYYGDVTSTQKYFGALGVYLRKYPHFKMPRRPVIEPIQRKFPPETMFKEAFEQKVAGQ